MLKSIILLFFFIYTSIAGKLPHLILTLVDDLGYHNIGFHNPDQISPGINEIVKEGVILESHYTYKYCSPTRSSFLSGRFPIHVNEILPENCQVAGGIDLRMTLLPEKLKKAGYSTQGVGKWHCGCRSEANLPNNRGFDNYFGFLGGGEDHFTQRNDGYVDLWRDLQPAYGMNGTYSCELYGQYAVNVIENHDPNTPLFLYLPFHDTHTPYQCPAEWLDAQIPFKQRQLMQGMTTCVDEATYNVTQALKKKGMWDDTLFVWSADNGGPQYWGGNNYPLRGGKWLDFEGGVRTAAFAAGGLIPKEQYGKNVTATIHIADWYSTFCNLAGVDPTDDIAGIPKVDGINVFDLLQTVNASNNRTYPIGSNAVRSGDFKYVNKTWKYDGRDQGYWTGPTWPVNSSHIPVEDDPGCPEDGCLFNIKEDPREKNEISAQNPEIYKEMKDLMHSYLEGAFQTNWTGGYDNCTTIKEYASRHKGFWGPLCTKGDQDLIKE